MICRIIGNINNYIVEILRKKFNELFKKINALWTRSNEGNSEKKGSTRSK
ncbi:Uncharacterised protein [Anaerostipes hadrus]|nr:Uncharacterised protein [Anaerostipes hadrus]